MEKNGIGTDASIPGHINNICERNYVQVSKSLVLLIVGLYRKSLFKGLNIHYNQIAGTSWQKVGSNYPRYHLDKRLSEY